MSLFRSTQPISTCTNQSCDGCILRNHVHCRSSIGDLVYFLLLTLPSLLIGGMGIYQFNPMLIAPWAVVILAFFGLMEIPLLNRWGKHGSPKLWRSWPFRMGMVQKLAFVANYIVIWGYPLVFLIIQKLWFFLAVYALASAGFFLTMCLHLCTECINFGCPLNRVTESVKKSFLSLNPRRGS